MNTFQLVIEAAGLPVPETEFRFAPPRRWRFDYCWQVYRLALEVEGGTWKRGGGRHNRGSGFAKDAEKYNEAALRGWTVLRVTTDMMNDGRALGLLQRYFGEKNVG